MWWTPIFCLSLLASAAGPTNSPDPIPSDNSGPVTLQDLDDQITITKEFIERYKMRAYMFNQKANSVMSRDYEGYRSAETIAQQSQGIVDDLTAHLQHLEQERAALLQKQGSTTSPSKPTTP